MRIMTFFKLIRYPNLLFVALTQYLLHYLLLKPLMEFAGLELSLNHLDFALLVLSTVCIAGAGYAINDYFDVQSDLINKPEKTYVDKGVHRRKAMLIHQVLTALGVLLGFYVALRIHHFRLGLIQPIVAGMLWFYSTGYKKQPLLGNLLVALLTGLVVLLVPLYEPHIFSPYFNTLELETSATLFKFFFIYFAFAFLLSLLREIVKDMEDEDGDSLAGCRTLPIIWGHRNTKTLLWILMAGVMGLLIFCQVYWAKQHFPIVSVYIYVLIQQPILLGMYWLSKATQKRDFSRLSNLFKLTMLMGILSIPFLYYFVWNS